MPSLSMSPGDVLHVAEARHPTTIYYYDPTPRFLRFQARVARVGQGFSERTADVASGSPVDPNPATTSRSAAASMAVDFYACAAPPGFGASRQWCSSQRARRCAPPRAHMQRDSINSPRLVAPHAARVRARECRRVRFG